MREELHASSLFLCGGISFLPEVWNSGWVWGVSSHMDMHHFLLKPQGPHCKCSFMFH